MWHAGWHFYASPASAMAGTSAWMLCHCSCIPWCNGFRLGSKLQPKRKGQDFDCTRRLRSRHRSQAMAAEAWNPQNVPGPQVTPSQKLSAVDTVKVQLDALRSNNEPWPNHGLLTMYEFGETIGGLERCFYFGHGKDLYHFDHFMGQFQNAYPELVNLKSYSIEGTKFEEDVHKVLVQVTSSIDQSQSQFVFILAEKDIGTKKGSLMTRCLIRHNPR